MARTVYKYRIDLSGKEKQLLRQARKKGRKDARLVLRILMILLANGLRVSGAAALPGQHFLLDCLTRRSKHGFQTLIAAPAVRAC